MKSAQLATAHSPLATVPIPDVQFAELWTSTPFAIRHSLLAQQALLALSIVDPACGSGHFLLAAARRLASHVARLQANGTPSGAQYRHALRQVVGHCIYGVDLNPMAVELCKVSLWMEAVEPGLPLTFLNSHIQHGNALLGTTPGLMAKGIPDAAWEPIEGDDRKVASALKKRNKQGSTGQRSLDTLWSQPADTGAQVVAKAVSELDSASDSDAAQLAKKEAKWEKILGSDEYRKQKFAADAWCAAFVWPKNPGTLAEVAPTNELWRQIKDAQGKPPPITAKTVEDLAAQYRFFHWDLQFPQVFTKGGFDVVLGNMPWERVKLQEQEFFAQRSPDIANAPNAAARKKLIAALHVEEPLLWQEWCAASRKSEGESHFLRQSARYPLCGQGDVNTFAVFAESNRSICGLWGAVGCILPAGIATDDTTKRFFHSLVESQALESLFHFENEERIFVEVTNKFRFVLLTILGARRSACVANLCAFARNTEHLRDSKRRYTLTASEIAVINPNTRTFPAFYSRRDADINLGIYRRAGVLWREESPDGNPWHLSFMAMLHMTNDSGLFRARVDLKQAGWQPEGNRFHRQGSWMVPLYEAKMVHHFDHRFATYEAATQANLNKRTLPQSNDTQHANPYFIVIPESCVSAEIVDERLGERGFRGWLLGWRGITYTNNERTVIPCIFPRAAVGNSMPLMLTSMSSEMVASLYACLCSFVLDYSARQKISGTNLNFWYLKQFPVFAPDLFRRATPWTLDRELCKWILPYVLELTYTAWDLEPFARDVKYNGPPFHWKSDRRFLLRCELDAAFFHVYGLNRADTAYIMDTFPIVRRNDENTHGEYRTKRVILEVYDAMAEAIRTGRPYETHLDPPPADPSCCHALGDNL